MTRFLLLVSGVLTCVLLAEPVSADDPPKKLTTDQRNELKAKLTELNTAGFKASQAGKYQDAAEAWQEALKIARQLYPESEFPDGHPNLATSLNNLAVLYESQGKYADAETLSKNALEMRRRLFKGDHLSVARSLNNLGALYKSQGKYADADPLFRDALDMYKRS